MSRLSAWLATRGKAPVTEHNRLQGYSISITQARKLRMSDRCIGEDALTCITTARPGRRAFLVIHCDRVSARARSALQRQPSGVSLIERRIGRISVGRSMVSSSVWRKGWDSIKVEEEARFELAGRFHPPRFQRGAIGRSAILPLFVVCYGNVFSINPLCCF